MAVVDAVGHAEVAARRSSASHETPSGPSAPRPNLGLYTGQDRDPHADVLFASIQTLGRTTHLERFGREAFDYIVVDEFHHGQAPTDRRLIDYFRPRFLLGLTATPERTDGGDLLALCHEEDPAVLGAVRVEGAEPGLAEARWRGRRLAG